MPITPIAMSGPQTAQREVEEVLLEPSFESLAASCSLSALAAAVLVTATVSVTGVSVTVAVTAAFRATLLIGWVTVVVTGARVTVLVTGTGSSVVVGAAVTVAVTGASTFVEVLVTTGAETRLVVVRSTVSVTRVVAVAVTRFSTVFVTVVGALVTVFTDVFMLTVVTGFGRTESVAAGRVVTGGCAVTVVVRICVTGFGVWVFVLGFRVVRDLEVETAVTVSRGAVVSIVWVRGSIVIVYGSGVLVTVLVSVA